MMDAPLMPEPDDGNTWMLELLRAGKFDEIKSALAADRSLLEQRDFLDDTPLLSAIEFGNLDLVKYMIALGADVNARSNDGMTAVAIAIEDDSSDSLAILRALLEAGAEVETITWNGWTALQLAAARGKLDKVNALIEAGADIHARKIIDAGETVLMEAAYGGHAAVVCRLLELGADSKERDRMDRTAADWAREQGHLEIASVLKAWGPK